jgi:hypothetical protein
MAGWTFGACAIKVCVECGEIDEFNHPARDRRWSDNRGMRMDRGL